MKKTLTAVAATAFLTLAVAGCGNSSGVNTAIVPGTGGTPTTPPAVSVPANSVAVFLTTQDLSKTLERQADLPFQAGAGAGAANNIVVDGSQKFQSLTAGFGIALTDTSSWLLQTQLTPNLRDQAMADLFSPTEGIGLTYLRVGIGGTDYNVSREAYTYNDLPAGESDPELAKFSVDHDRQYIIPAVQQALRLNPAIVMTATPWSAPAWMKTDGMLVPMTPASFLKRDAFAPWAQYFVKFVKGYAEAGIHFDHISTQDEPYNLLLAGPALAVGGFIPAMFLTQADAVTLVNDHLAPAFKANGITAKIAIYEDGYAQGLSYIPLVMGQAAANVGAFAFHCYLNEATTLAAFNAIYPDIPRYQTECSSKLNNIEPAQAMIRGLNNFLNGFQLWNAALDPAGGPKFGAGCRGLPGTTFANIECTAPVTVDPETKTYTLTADYWVLGHFSQFIKLGARRIGSSGLVACVQTPAPPPCGLEGTVFENPDGTRALVVTTNNGQPSTFTITDAGKHVSYMIPAGATATFIWRP